MSVYSRVNVIVSRRDVSGRSTIVNYASRAKRVKIRQVSGRKRVATLPIGPLQVQYDDIGLEYVEIERPGEIPLLESTAKKSRKITFEAILANPQTSGLTSVERIINILQVMAIEDIDVVFIYGVRTIPFRLRITDFSYSSVRRDLNGNIIQAVASIQLTERPRFEVDPVTLNAIQYTPPKTVSKSKPSSGSSGTGGGGSTKNTSTRTPVTVVDKSLVDGKPKEPPPSTSRVVRIQ